ncbi:MAG: hypothetical protein OFPII_12900 [Osedax symbiont Rs1]|nr:MAG: hypothetical protein OFPII_12900 [Osedax symbiont Rs1]
MSKHHAIKIFSTFVMLSVVSSLSGAATEIKGDSPSEYVVKKGDTLWDIAGVFLQSPWKWPSLWEKNSQIKNPHLIYPDDVIYLLYRNGEPYFSTSKGGSGKLSPKVRAVGKFSPITAIPRVAMQAFVGDHRIVDASRIGKMPYVLAGVGLRDLIGSGDEIYIRGALDPEFNQYQIYRIGKVYGIKDGLSTENSEIIKIGTVDLLEKEGDISRAIVTESNGLIKKGDIIVRGHALQLQPLYYLAAAPQGVTGKIISAVNQAHKITRYDGVVLNLGVDTGVFPGHVFSVLKAPRQVKDPRTGEMVLISNQVIGELMIVNVFENLSYGIILNAKGIVSPGDSIVPVQ